MPDDPPIGSLWIVNTRIILWRESAAGQDSWDGGGPDGVVQGGNMLTVLSALNAAWIEVVTDDGRRGLVSHVYFMPDGSRNKRALSRIV